MRTMFATEQEAIEAREQIGSSVVCGDSPALWVAA